MTISLTDEERTLLLQILGDRQDSLEENIAGPNGEPIDPADYDEADREFAHDLQIVRSLLERLADGSAP